METLKEAMHGLRVFPPPELVVLGAPENVGGTRAMSPDHCRLINNMLRRDSGETTLTIAALPPIPDTTEAEAARGYIESIEALALNTQTMVLIGKGEPGSIVSTHI